MFDNLFMLVGPVASSALLFGLLLFPLITGLAWTLATARPLALEHEKRAASRRLAARQRFREWLRPLRAQLCAFNERQSGGRVAS